MKRDLAKTFTDPSDNMIVSAITNVNDEVNNAGNKKLDEVADEVASEVTGVYNANLLSQMVGKNEIRVSLILEKTTVQKKRESKQQKKISLI